MEEKYSYCLDGDRKPVLCVEVNECFTLETENAFGGKIENEEKLNKLLRSNRHHPISGPVFIKGIHAGECIEVTIVEMSFKTPGYQCLSRSSGILHMKQTSRNLKKIYKDNKFINYDNYTFYAQPSVGVIGTAITEKTRSGRLGSSGGNIDIKELGVGAKIILPCNYEGGLLYVGDMHLLQGNGEITGIAAEVGGNITLSVKKSLKIYNFPILCLDNGLNFIGYGESIEKAMASSVNNALQYICQEFKIEFNDAYMILGIIGNVVLGHSTGKIVSSGIFIDNKYLDELKLKNSRKE